MSQNEPEETASEAYHTIIKLVRQRDAELQALRAEVNELKRARAEPPKTQGNIVAHCAACKAGLTGADIQASVCPHCGKSSKYKLIGE